GIAGQPTRLDSQRPQPLIDLRILVDDCQLGDELCDDRLVKTGGADPAESREHLETVQRFGKCRNVWREGIALRRANSDRPRVAGLGLLPSSREVVTGELYLARNQVLHLLIGGAICDRHNLKTGLLSEHLAADV